jgi:hypothetical protein
LEGKRELQAAPGPRRWRQRPDHGDVIESPNGEFVLWEDYDRVVRSSAELDEIHIDLIDKHIALEAVSDEKIAWLRRNIGGMRKWIALNYAGELSAADALEHISVDIERIAGGPLLCPHGMPLADNTCGPCSKGKPNTLRT